MSIITSRSGTGDSTVLEDSVGTLLSIAPSSISAQAPRPLRAGRQVDDKERRKEKQKEKESIPSGLSLSRPASFVEEEDDSSTSDDSSEARSSSAESEFRDDPRHQLSVGYLPFNPGQVQIIRPQLTHSQLPFSASRFR
jgi:hypothetical protein